MFFPLRTVAPESGLVSLGDEELAGYESAMISWLALKKRVSNLG
jgi:hypothetical protein